ncbi:MAG: hypothetical protein ACJA2P_000724 [Rhodoferax sp.]|jgi:hypothetical protein
MTVPLPALAILQTLVLDAPPMLGADYLKPLALAQLWATLDTALQVELTASGPTLQGFLKACHPAWNRVGRVVFNLAENRKDPEAPFAFLATYTSGLSAQVIGSSLYRIQVSVAPVAPAHWKTIGTDCAGSIDTLVGLLQGQLSAPVMARICQPETGLFPAPRDIRFKCSCPDSAAL